MEEEQVQETPPEEERPEIPPAKEITEEEKLWAILAHVSILLSLVTVGLLGPVAAFVIWLIKKDWSDYVGKQALQSLIYQIVVVVLSWVMWLAIAVLSSVAVGLCCIPVGIIADLAAVGYGCYAAYVCSLGQVFKYPVIGDMVGIE